MATRLILKNNKIGTTNPPTGYKFIGYNNNALSERLSNGDVNLIGGSLSDVRIATITLNASQISGLFTTPITIPFSSFIDASAGQSIFLLPHNGIWDINNDGTPFVIGSGRSIRISNSDGKVILLADQTSIETGGIYFGNGTSNTLQRSIPNTEYTISCNAEITGGGTTASITINLYYKLYTS